MSLRRSPERKRAIKQLKLLVKTYRRLGGQAEYVAGWKNRGGDFPDYRAALDHHDGSAPGETPGIINVLLHGRPDLSGPLSNLALSYGRRWIDKMRGLRSRPTLRVVAAGVANHAGVGGWPGAWKGRGSAPRGNAHLLGVEIDLTHSEKVHAELRHAIDLLHVAQMLTFGWTARETIGHKEWAPGRKTDPTYSMRKARKRARRLRKQVCKQHPWARKQWREARGLPPKKDKGR